MKIVVGILNKDCALQLRNCLESLLQQSFRNFAVVVVDGNSEDSSLSILQEYSLKDNRVRYFLQKSKGTGMARNEVIEYIKDRIPDCEKIIWGDAENVYDVNYIKELIKNIKNQSIVGGVNVIDSEKPLSQSLWWYYNGWRGGAVSGNNECVDVKAYEGHKYADIVRGEDSLLHIELLQEGYTLNHCSEAICYIKSAEYFKDFLKWTRLKARGLYQWGSLKNTISSTLRNYLLFNVLIWTYVILLFASVLFSPLFLVLLLLPPLTFSIFFWFKGQSYVRTMKRTTTFYFIPVLILHFSVMFSELLRLSLFQNCR